MQGKPILSIKDFAGSGEGGIWFNNGFAVHTEGGQSMLVESFKQSSVFSDATTGFTDIKAVSAIQYLTRWAYASTSDDINFLIGLDNEGHFFVSDFDASMYDGKILEDFSDSSSYPDLFKLPSGNVIAAQNRYVAKLFLGACHSDSTTGKIVDRDGRNFETLGVVTGEVVTNLVTGTTYTITGISDENATKDALTFTAGATANSADDDFITYDYNAFDLGTAGAGSPRQIVPFDDYWFITNGNYLAVLDSDETTFDAQFKQLPVGHTALSIAVNGSQVAVLSSFNGKGYFLYWDGYSDGWLNIREIKGMARSVKNYENGFVYLASGRLYYTDGYNESLLGEYSDTNDACSSLANIEAYGFNSMLVSNGMVFVASNKNDYNRVFPGIYYWSKDYGWGYMPTVDVTRQSWGGGLVKDDYPVSIFKNDFYKRIDVGYTTGLNKITDSGDTTTTTNSKSAIFYMVLPEEIHFTQVGLNIGVNPNYYSQTGTDAQCKITVNIGDGRSGITKYFTAVTAGSASILTNTTGATHGGFLNKEVLILNGTNSGQRTFVTAITNTGTNTEAWAISPALSSTDTAKTAIQYMLDTTDTKTIDIDEINKTILFNTEKEYRGNKLILEIVVHGVANAFPVAIEGVHLYA